MWQITIMLQFQILEACGWQHFFYFASFLYFLTPFAACTVCLVSFADTPYVHKWWQLKIYCVINWYGYQWFILFIDHHTTALQCHNTPRLSHMLSSIWAKRSSYLKCEAVKNTSQSLHGLKALFLFFNLVPSLNWY